MSFSGNRTLCAVIGFLVAVALATIAYRTIYRADVDNTASVDQDRNNLVNAVSVSQGLAKSGGSDESGASIKTELHIDPIVPNDQVDQGANVVQPTDDGKSNDGEEPIVDADHEKLKKVLKSVKTTFDQSIEVVDPPKDEPEFVVPTEVMQSKVEPTKEEVQAEDEPPKEELPEEEVLKVEHPPKGAAVDPDAVNLETDEVVGPPKEQSELVVPPEVVPSKLKVEPTKEEVQAEDEPPKEELPEEEVLKVEHPPKGAAVDPDA
eukprot:477757_1